MNYPYRNQSKPIPKEKGMNADGFSKLPFSSRKLLGLNSCGYLHCVGSVITPCRKGTTRVP